MQRVGAASYTDTTNDFLVEERPAASGGCGGTGRETDEHRLAQRQKQVDYGKNTIGYERYVKAVPRDRRKRTDPQTPDIGQRMSKRAFDAVVKRWRRQLHEWDVKDGEAAHTFVNLGGNDHVSSNPEGNLPAASKQACENEGDEAAGCLTTSHRASGAQPQAGSSRKRALRAVQVNRPQEEGNNKRQHTAGSSKEVSPLEEIAAVLRQGSSSLQESLREQENRAMEAAATAEAADIFQDWEDGICI